ncbi:transcriptional regulator [Azorhizobium oxalatiphilum]|uniref:Transcriptional regulator n=1 Tax=Azorhizobium oxalatiphilum TaxID=980631 RepID=A0A917C8A9_9HYPH|nr:helix-turn-helix domain-containing protein [Azorhizobium oxalatiphilum]GGF74522.1 transcriptional regulator [Azorhizobium oxalatiphilum]
MSQILKNVHADAVGLKQAGLIDDVTMREFDALSLPQLPAYSADDIQRIRSKAKVSQAVFAAFLNVKKITIAAWEQGTKKPNGTAIKLLNLVDRKGLDALM